MMTRSRQLVLAAAVAAALTACEARFGNDAEPSGNGSAENKAAEGEVSINAPGFQMKINIPEGIRREANIHDDSGIIYPGSIVGGIHVEGGRERGKGDGEVELRFTSADAPDRVAAWYRDPARARDFTLAAANREGEAHVFAGTTKDGGRFRVRLAPHAGGGTEGRALLTETN
jgi:hypothetical protein